MHTRISKQDYRPAKKVDRRATKRERKIEEERGRLEVRVWQYRVHSPHFSHRTKKKPAHAKRLVVERVDTRLQVFLAHVLLLQLHHATLVLDPRRKTAGGRVGAYLVSAGTAEAGSVEAASLSRQFGVGGGDLIVKKVGIPRA